MWTDPAREDKYTYHEGFGSYISSEAVKGALPERGNNPQKCPYGLYAEQLSGTAFTVPRHENKRTWLYRIRPSVGHTPLEAYEHKHLHSSFSPKEDHIDLTSSQLRWSPFKITTGQDWVDGLRTLAGGGDVQAGNGIGIHIYTADKNMERRAFYNSDGDFLIVPQQGRLDIKTEFGSLLVHPTEIAIIQRGMKFSIDLPDGPSRGYVMETYKGHLALPDLGPIGANGLAEPRDFKAPSATYEDIDEEWTIVNKFSGQMFECTQYHSPYDVVAFHGNYLPWKYDLNKFTVIGSVSHDHPDPSIFTVLTCRSDSPGTAVADFVVFAPRWLVQEDTFRPPWFHRNCMAEFMGLISGDYDAKAGGFSPGGASLHNTNTAHGPDAEVFEKASNAPLKPMKVGEGSFAFMFESSFQLATTKFAIRESGELQEHYWEVWQGLKPHFRDHFDNSNMSM